jgi:hypothetical protein
MISFFLRSLSTREQVLVFLAAVPMAIVVGAFACTWLVW